MNRKSIRDCPKFPTPDFASLRLDPPHKGEGGKGVHAAGLNFGDCFAYALAKAQGCSMLYVGDDFARIDIEAVDG